MLKLEQKFKSAMAQVAELTGEKEQLEHLVVQLQEETDTVGKSHENSAKLQSNLKIWRQTTS